MNKETREQATRRFLQFVENNKGSLEYANEILSLDEIGRIDEDATDFLKVLKEQNYVGTWNVEFVDVLFYHYINVVNCIYGKSGTDSDFGFGFPGGGTLQMLATPITGIDKGDDRFQHFYQAAIESGGETVTGGSCQIADKYSGVIGLGIVAGITFDISPGNAMWMTIGHWS